MAFTAPADDGGGPVFAYTATCTTADGSLGATRSGKVSPLRVGGLVPGKSYTCRVAARNAVGLGAFSAVSVPVCSVSECASRHAGCTHGRPCNCRKREHQARLDQRTGTSQVSEQSRRAPR
ncbi:MAG: fibronectin type III domain-containing protein [Acidimicrobiia bacterium]